MASVFPTPHPNALEETVPAPGNDTNVNPIAAPSTPATIVASATTPLTVSEQANLPSDKKESTSTSGQTLVPSQTVPTVIPTPSVALAEVIKTTAKPYDSSRNKFQHVESEELEEESAADTYSILIQTLLFVCCIIAAKLLMRKYMPWKGEIDLGEIGLVFTGLFFIMGQMFSNVYADVKEADKMPMDVCSSLDQLEDCFVLSSAKVADKVNLLDAQHLIVEFARNWRDMLIRVNDKSYGDCLNALADIVDLAREWDKKGAANTSAILTVVDKIRRVIARGTIIKRTDVLPAARALLHFFVLMSCVLLFLASYKTEVGLAVVMACVMTVCIFMARIIQNMDDPFNIRPTNRCMKWVKGHMAAVQIFPLIEYIRRMERKMENEFEGMRQLQMKKAAVMVPGSQ